MTNQTTSQQNKPCFFIEANVQENYTPWCVDGRKDKDNHKPGPHMLGGSLHPLVLKALAKGTRFNEQFVLENSTVLKNAGYSLGVHRGIHYDRENCKSDCGFA